MSLILKGIDIPKDCIECPLEEVTVDGDGFDYWYCKITESKADTNKRPSNCPLIQIDRPHGRLIDESEIWFDHSVARSLDDGHNWDELVATKDGICGVPTILEAEE